MPMMTLVFLQPKSPRTERMEAQALRWDEFRMQRLVVRQSHQMLHRFLQVGAQWNREINVMWNEAAPWPTSWRHAWTRNAVKLVNWIWDTVEYEGRQKSNL